MALISANFLDCVVAIGLGERHRPSSYKWQATGVLVGRPMREIEEDGVPKNVYTIYLVTNRHVFEHFEEAGAKSFVVGFNPESAEKGGVEIYSLSLADDGERLWTAHRTEDVAVIPLNVALLKQQQRHFEFFRLEQSLPTRAKMKSEGVSEGDFVYMVGYPLGLADLDWHYPIVRSGSIARIRDTIEGRKSTFLLDILNFPGSSGSPVVTRPEMAAVEGTQPLGKAYVIGIISGFLPYAGAVSNDTGKRGNLVQNSGLAVCVSSECIQEAIEDDLEKRGRNLETEA